MSGRLTRMLRLFVPGSIRSREGARWCQVDPLPSGSYNHQILRSRAEGDFVRYPDYLWSPTPYWTARGGLNGHLRELADRLDGLVYSDVLIILHPEDHARTEASLLSSWEASARAELAECFDRLVSSQGYTKAFPDRPLQLQVVRDGDPRLGALVGLEPGEFATAMLPNLYLGPVETSAPLVEVFVADERGRFESVGTLYSDQLAFNVGAHALDNGRVDRLGDSALYTLHRFPGQVGLHHKVNGERADRVVLETGKAHGGETVRLVDRSRDKVLLEVMIVAARELDAEVPDGREVGGPRPLVGLPGFLPAADAPATILPEGVDLGTFGAFSVIPEALPHRIHTLSERAFLLQRIHFREEMVGYHVELDRRGEVGPGVPDPIARIEVVEDRVAVVSLSRDLAVDGAPLQPDQKMALRGNEHRITWRDGETTFRPMRRVGDRRWPYVGRLDSPRRSTPLPEGDVWTIGRDSQRCDVPLPDRDLRTNIRWRDGRTEGPVQVQGGRVERGRFRTDAICVASRAASIDLTGVPSLENLSERCPVHIVRGPEVIRLKNGSCVPLRAGDELLIGNQAFRLVAPGGLDVDTLVEQIAPPKPPGGRGRRPTVGGRPGALVDRARTLRAVLDLDPSAEGRPPVRAPRPPEPVVALVEIEDPGSPILPTHALPSLSLDPTMDGWMNEDDPLGALDGAPTIVEDNPDWTALLVAASQHASVEEAPVLSPVGPTREYPPEEAKAVQLVRERTPVPRGLRLERQVSPDVRPRRLRGSRALPGFGPLPPRARFVAPTPSVPGD